MIVELFGPPAVGKTRFARALEALARTQGLTLCVVASERPAERVAQARLPAVLARLKAVRATVLTHWWGARDAVGPESLLLAIPPRSLLWTLRLGGYLRRLDATMRRGAVGGDIMVVDQGFVQLLGSLLVLARDPCGPELAMALEAAPRGDVLVRLDAAPWVLLDRIEARLRGMSWTERWLELDLSDNLAFGPHLDRVQTLLEAGGVPVITVDSTTPETLQIGVEAVLAAVLARRSPAQVPSLMRVADDAVVE